MILAILQTSLITIIFVIITNSAFGKFNGPLKKITRIKVIPEFRYLHFLDNSVSYVNVACNQGNASDNVLRARCIPIGQNGTDKVCVCVCVCVLNVAFNNCSVISRRWLLVA